MNNKERFKLNKNFYGRLHYKTIKVRPLLIFIVPFLLLLAFGKTLKTFLNKLTLNYKYKIAKKKNDGKKVEDTLSLIAFYLPQYHEIKENNEWWGEGFTEWTNVKKALPVFEGHYQPHIPHEDVGFYDLSDVNVMKKQAKMAKEHGIGGFCFYYYHFKDGKRLLEKPINNYIKAKEIDFPFCFAWANENWTRTWDGGEKNIIMHQQYDDENMINMIMEMLEGFKDSRYIKIDGMPVLLVYRAEIIPNIQKVVAKWRFKIKEQGFDGIYLISMQNFKSKNPSSMGFDGAVEFAPKNPRSYFNSKTKLPRFKDANARPSVFDFASAMNNLKYVNKPYPYFRCVNPGWDNTPRRQDRGRIFIGQTPKLFEEFLRNAVKLTIAYPNKKNFIFINAWNEWGEGAHLEPDQKNGYAFLEICKKIMAEKI